MADETAKKRKAEEKGRKAEAQAALWLKFKGYVLLDRRFKHPSGEVDLIAQFANTVAFVEVKQRKTTQEALEAVTPEQRRRVEAAAEAWIAQNPERQDLNVRFDVCAVSAGFLNFVPAVEHLTDAWRPGD